MTAFLAIYVCLSGPHCPQKDIPSSKIFYSRETCEQEGKLVAQGMFVMSGSGDRYGVRCVPVDYDPPILPEAK